MIIWLNFRLAQHAKSMSMVS